MENKTFTCIECPRGCTINVTVFDDGKISSEGYSCQRGAAYVVYEIKDPQRTVTSTVRLVDGRMCPVKTEDTIPRAAVFEVMNKIAGVHPSAPIRVGDVLYANICENVNLVSTDDID